MTRDVSIPALWVTVFIAFAVGFLAGRYRYPYTEPQEAIGIDVAMTDAARPRTATAPPTWTQQSCPGITPTAEVGRRVLPNPGAAEANLGLAYQQVEYAHGVLTDIFYSTEGAFDGPITGAVNALSDAMAWMEEAGAELQFWMDAGYFVCPTAGDMSEFRMRLGVAEDNVERALSVVGDGGTAQLNSIGIWNTEALYHLRYAIDILDNAQPGSLK